MNKEFDNFNEQEVNDYHDATDNRAQAQRLLAKLKAKEAQGMATSKVFWVNQQPTLVESSSKMQWDSRVQALGFGRPSTKGLPATQSNPRVPAGWEAKMERQRKKGWTLDEMPVMKFKGSGNLPAHYYMDESALEAYVESLTNE